MGTNYLNLRDDKKSDIKKVLKDIEGKEKVILYFHGGLSNDEYMKDTLGPILLNTMLSTDILGDKTHVVFMQYNAGLFQLDHFKELLQLVNNNVDWKMIALFVAKLLGVDISFDKRNGSSEIVLPDEKKRNARLFLEKLKFKKKFLDKSEIDDFDELEITDKLKNYLINDDEIDITEIVKINAFLPDEFDLLKRENVQEMIKKDLFLIHSKSAENRNKSFVSIYFWVKVAKLAYRIIKRIALGTDHGLYTTTIEEISRIKLAKFIGVDAIAQAHWNTIYKHSQEIWINSNGQYFLEGLSKIYNRKDKNNHSILIDVMSHSAGSIPISYLIQELSNKNNDKIEFKINNVLLTVPALRISLFEKNVLSNKSIFTKLKMYLLDDQSEVDNNLVPLLYLRSLLYFVSGIAEIDEAKGDMTLLGMHRYYIDEKPYNTSKYNSNEPIFGNIGSCKKYLIEEGEDRMIFVSKSETVEDSFGMRVIKTEGASHSSTKFPCESPELARDIILHLTENRKKLTPEDCDGWHKIMEDVLS